MKKITVALLLTWQLLHADVAHIRVVNAASFLEDKTLAPGSIISILGSNLTNTTAAAADLSNLPTTLGGVTVKIGNTSLVLFYVSPRQVNARIDPSIATGAATLTLTSPTGTFTKNITLGTSTPGIFSLEGSGTRDGAIQNAVTFALQPFSVTTAGNPTYLAIYTTGLDLSTAPTVTIGGVQVTVQFYGDAPCCPGLQQINVQLSSQLAGAGRVEVSITAGGKTSNIVEVVILPNKGHGDDPPKNDHAKRNREIAGLAYIPGTSLALLTDENDDVVRVIDIQARKVTKTIALTSGAGPTAAAVTADGKLAVVAERSSGKAAILDLAAFNLITEVAVGGGPSSVSINGTVAAVANQDSDNVSVIDLTSNTVAGTVDVGRGPRGVSIDSANNKAYVTNQDAGTVSVIDMTNLAAASTTIPLDANARPAAIGVIPSLGLAAITEPSGGSNGKVLILNLTTGTFTSIAVNPDRSGGSSDLAIWNTTVYFANQSGGSVTIAPIAVDGSGNVTFTTATVKADIGARALTVDTQDKLLLVTSEGSGDIVIIDLTTNTVVGRIDAVRSEDESEGEDVDNHDDHNQAANAPAVTGLNPTSGAAGTTIALTITGTKLTGATEVELDTPSSMEMGHGSSGGDDSIKVTGVTVNAAGTQITCNVQISASAAKGARVVRVQTPGGESSKMPSAANTFTIN
ncbi:MAG TPA: hypothetical protein VJN43_16320 [Bryobacteraceae bacterium]|nr:hypothetical protein [Bryobacteraceae bacterium]